MQIGLKLKIRPNFGLKSYFKNYYKSSAVAEMGDCGHNRHGPKSRAAAVPLFQGSWAPI